MNIKKLISDILPEVIENRRTLHQNPELSTQEFETMKTICTFLDRHNIEYQSGVADTGVVAIVRGKKDGKTVGIRADIDALPVTEENDLSFCSVNKGVMHACGHDAHTAILMGAAKVIKDMEEEINGNVKFFFQPAEEQKGGADRMIKEGCLLNPNVSHAIGLHVMPNVPIGKIELKRKQLNGNSGGVKIIVKGKQGHAAYPDTAVDAVVVSAYIITALQTMVSRNTSPLTSVVLTFGKITGGEKANIISKEVTLLGTLRTLSTPARQKAKDEIKRIAENVALSMDAEAEVIFNDGYIALINDDKVMDIVEETAIEIVGKENIVYKEFPSMGGEDFSYFTDAIPSAFFHLGAGNESKSSTAPLHSDKFILDEDCMATGIEMEVRTVLKLLKRDVY